MTELVLNLSRAGFNSLSTSASGFFERIHTPARTRDIIWIGILLVALQVLDGLLTGIGVMRFGTEIEANPLIRSLMEQWGHINALVAVKLCAIVIVGILCRLAIKVGWVTFALQGVILLYLAAAIVPWTAILLFRAI
ncbi:MAG: hypothetical protein J5J00_05130 [Deltaproteobacteria bacterium]|nr:hypothetical protein [Deltaproteobacteria bacterium]